MQIRTLLVAIHTFTLKLLVACLGFILLTSGVVSAQYGRDTYGSCEYGVNCPEEPEPDPVDDGTTDGGNNGNNQGGDEEGDDGEDGDEDDQGEDVEGNQDDDDNQGNNVGGRNNGNNSGSGGFTSNGSESPARRESFGIIEIVRSPIEFVKQLPPEQQAVLPYYTWILLLILAIILIIQAYVDRYKTNRLKLQLAGLESTINEQKMFLHLVLHHLNTPVSLIKNTLELVQSDSSSAPAAQKLNPTALELGDTVEDITTNKLESSPEAIVEQATIEQARDYSAWRERLYYILPVAVAVIFGLVLTYLLYKAEAIQPVHYAQYQIGVAIMASFIFINAVRLYRINRIQVRVLSKSKELAERINQQRNQVILSLSQNLENITINLLAGANGIKNAKYKELFMQGIHSIVRIYNRARASVQSLSNTESNFEIQNFMTAALLHYQPQIQEKHLAITSEYRIPTTIITYAQDLTLAIESVLENSILYNKENGSIDIQAWMEGNRMVIDVTDTGQGMSETELQQAFKPFYQEADVLKFDHGGASLSLFAAQKALERLGGSIKLASQKGKGTQARISLPVGL